MEGEIRVRAVKGRCVIGSLATIVKERNVFMEVKRGLRNSILPTLMCGSETWTWKRAQIKNACCGNKLSDRSMWHDKMEG